MEAELDSHPHLPVADVQPWSHCYRLTHGQEANPGDKQDNIQVYTRTAVVWIEAVLKQYGLESSSNALGARWRRQ